MRQITALWLWPPDGEADVRRSMLEVTICREQCVLMTDGELRDERVDRAELNAGLPAGVPHLRTSDVVVAVGLHEGHARESLDDLRTSSVRHETLKDLLQDQTGRDDDVIASECADKLIDRRDVLWTVASKRERPDARIDEKAHPRERSAL